MRVNEEAAWAVAVGKKGMVDADSEEEDLGEIRDPRHKW